MWGAPPHLHRPRKEPQEPQEQQQSGGSGGGGSSRDDLIAKFGDRDDDTEVPMDAFPLVMHMLMGAPRGVMAGGAGAGGGTGSSEEGDANAITGLVILRKMLTQEQPEEQRMEATRHCVSANLVPMMLHKMTSQRDAAAVESATIIAQIAHVGAAVQPEIVMLLVNQGVVPVLVNMHMRMRSAPAASAPPPPPVGDDAQRNDGDDDDDSSEELTAAVTEALEALGSVQQPELRRYMKVSGVPEEFLQ